MNEPAARRLQFSIVIPSWQDAENLARLLPALRKIENAHELIVVDASSENGPQEIAAANGAQFVRCNAPNRGAQMNVGAMLARGDVLIFQHADTELRAAHLDAIETALQDRDTIGGAFYRKFDERHPHLRWLEKFARLLTRRGGTLFGDQTVFVRRETFLQLRGFAQLPLMEDVEFSKRLRAAGRIAVLDPPVRSSPRHHLQHGAWRTSIRNGLFLFLFKLGVSPQRMHRWYYGAPKKSAE